MPIILNRKIFYSYWDVNGDGINPEHLQTYSSSVIFDSYNRALYAYGEVFGNHQMGTYHGEIFNDFETNNAYGDYSSASGSNVTSYNAYEHGFGHYNESKPGETIFTVGNGTEDDRHNAFEIHEDSSSYVNGYLYAENSYVQNISYSYFAYISYQAHVNNNLWVHGRSVRKALETMVRMFPNTDDQHTYDGFYNGPHYVWVGKDMDLPAPEERYANVFYIVCDEAPSPSLPVFDDETWDDIVIGDDGETTIILFADDANPERSDDRVLRYDRLATD